MQTIPWPAADSVLALAALVGTLATMVVIRVRSIPDGLATRLLFAFSLVAGILVMRLLAWHVYAPLFDFSGRVIAAWIPLAALVVLEGLERRHAPRSVKLAALAAGTLCSLLALLPVELRYPNYILLAVQLAAFATVYWLALTDSRDGLSTSEVRALARLRIALPILLVCVATDYGVFADWVPLRGSSVAILFLCWMVIGTTQATASRWDALTVLAAATAAGVLVGLAAGIGSASWVLGMQAGAMALATAILALVVNEAIHAFTTSRRDDVLRALAQADLTDIRRFMAELTDRSQLSGTTIIADESLADFDRDTLASAFTRHSVMDRRDLEGFAEETRQQLESLFITHDATHLMLLSARPLRIAAMTLAAVGSVSALKTELAVVQRMAALVSARQGNGMIDGPA